MALWLSETFDPAYGDAVLVELPHRDGLQLAEASEGLPRHFHFTSLATESLRMTSPAGQTRLHGRGSSVSGDQKRRAGGPLVARGVFGPRIRLIDFHRPARRSGCSFAPRNILAFLVPLVPLQASCLA